MYESSSINWVIERVKIIDVVVGFANTMDAKDWQKLQGYLANEIDIDYSEFRGERPQQISAQEYVQERIKGLTGLKTLHISTNHEVTIQEKSAQCKSAYRIYRIDPTQEPGQERLDTAGNYLHQLMKVDENWQIKGIRQTVVIMSGNPQVHGALRNVP